MQQLAQGYRDPLTKQNGKQNSLIGSKPVNCSNGISNKLSQYSTTNTTAYGAANGLGRDLMADPISARLALTSNLVGGANGTSGSSGESATSSTCQNLVGRDRS